MKVIGDLGAFLKRNEHLSVECYYKAGRFYAKTASVDQHATNLGDALGYVQEEYARRANGIDPMRDDGKGKAGDCVKAPQMMHTTIPYTIPKYPVRVNVRVSPGVAKPTTPYPGQCTGCGAMISGHCACKPPIASAIVTAACGTVTQKGGTCPTCSGLVFTGDNKGFRCFNGHSWPASSGRFAVGSMGPSKTCGTWEYNLATDSWIKVTP